MEISILFASVFSSQLLASRQSVWREVGDDGFETIQAFKTRWIIDRLPVEAFGIPDILLIKPPIDLVDRFTTFNLIGLHGMLGDRHFPRRFCGLDDALQLFDQSLACSGVFTNPVARLGGPDAPRCLIPVDRKSHESL